MGYDDPEKIVKMVDEKNKELSPLKDRFEADYKLWTMPLFKLSEKKGEWDNYTSNEAKNLANKIMEILGYAPLKISIPQGDDKEKERKDKAAAERFIYGALNIADSRLKDTVQPSIQEQLAFYAVLRGWVAVRAFIHAEEDGGEAFPDIAVWDVLNVTWDVGPNGKLWVCHKRPITETQAHEEYKIENPGKKPIAYDFWDEEKYQVIIDKKVILGPEEHGQDHPPIMIGMVGPAPFIQSGELSDTIQYVGESIYGPERHLFPVKNKILTYYMTLIGQSVHNPLVVSYSGGKPNMKENPYYKGSVTYLDVDKKQKIEPLFKPVMPQDAAAMVSMIQQELTMGGVLPLLSGIDEAGGSGYRANLLLHAASSILKPRQNVMEKTYEWLGRELLSQYKEGDFGALRVRGKDESGKSFDTEISPGDIKGDWFPEAELSPRLPEDEPAKFAMYETAVRSGIFSAETGMEKLGIPDTEAEKGRIWREKADSVPSVTVRKIMKELVDDGRADIAKQVWEEYQKSLGQGTGQQTGQQTAKGMPSSVVPPQEVEANHLTPDQQEIMKQNLKLKALGLERGR
jgi:hypothetical protein